MERLAVVPLAAQSLELAADRPLNHTRERGSGARSDTVERIDAKIAAALDGKPPAEVVPIERGADR